MINLHRVPIVDFDTKQDFPAIASEIAEKWKKTPPAARPAAVYVDLRRGGDSLLRMIKANGISVIPVLGERNGNGYVVCSSPAGLNSSSHEQLQSPEHRFHSDRAATSECPSYLQPHSEEMDWTSGTVTGHTLDRRHRRQSNSSVPEEKCRQSRGFRSVVGRVALWLVGWTNSKVDQRA